MENTEKKYEERFSSVIELLDSGELTGKARLPEYPNAFKRERKMPLPDILRGTLGKRGKTTVIEIRDYFKEKGSGCTVSKQDYFQRRKQLNYEVFSEINERYLENFYEGAEPKTWHDYIVLAADGSKAEVPNSGENKKTFGVESNKTGGTVSRALLSCVVDVFNDFILDIQIARFDAAENDLLKKQINPVQKKLGEQKFILIADRNYPSLEMVDYLEAQGITYLFRLNSVNYKKERDAMQGNDEEIVIEHTGSRLGNIKKKDPEREKVLRAKGSTRTRIIKVLVEDTEITLMTNIPVDISTKEVQELYLKRWEIEKKYNTLKNKMKFESVTGNASVYVYQDFWAQVVVYNMAQDVMHSADESLQQRMKETGELEQEAKETEQEAKETKQEAKETEQETEGLGQEAKEAEELGQEAEELRQEVKETKQEAKETEQETEGLGQETKEAEKLGQEAEELRQEVKEAKELGQETEETEQKTKETEETGRKKKKKKYKHPQRINENIAIGLFKEQFVRLMVEQNKERRLELMQQLQGDIERNFLPVRTLPTTPRKFHISNKYQLNLKPSF